MELLSLLLQHQNILLEFVILLNQRIVMAGLVSSTTLNEILNIEIFDLIK